MPSFRTRWGASILPYSTFAKWTSEFKFDREGLDVIRIVDGQKALFIAKVQVLEDRRPKVYGFYMVLSQIIFSLSQ